MCCHAECSRHVLSHRLGCSSGSQHLLSEVVRERVCVRERECLLVESTHPLTRLEQGLCVCVGGGVSLLLSGESREGVEDLVVVG